MAFGGLKPGSGRRLYAAAATATWGSAGTITHVFEHECESPRLEITNNQLSDREYASGNTGMAEKKRLPVDKQLRADFSLWASLEAIGVFGYHGSGTSDTKSGASAPYLHTGPFVNAPFYLGGMTIEEHLYGATADTDVDVNFVSCAVDKFELSWGETGFAKINVGLIGSGETANATTQTEGSLTIPSYLIASSKIRVRLEPAVSEGQSPWAGTQSVSATAGAFPALDTGEVDISQYVESGSFLIDNKSRTDAQTGTSTGAGVYLAAPFVDAQEVRVNLKMKHGTDIEALLRSNATRTVAAQKEYCVILDIAGGTANYGCQITVPLAVITDNPGGGAGTGLQTYDYSFQARKVSGGTDREVAYLWLKNADNYDYC